MPNNLSNFLTKVSVEPRSSIKFQRDPKATLDSALLSADAKQAVLSKDPTKIRDIILKEKGVLPGKNVSAAGDIEVVLVIVI